MKKLVASLFAATVMAAGLVTVSGETAANAAEHVYTPSIGTATHVTGPKKVKHGKQVKVRARVSTGAKGTVTVTVRRGTKLVKRVTVAPGAPVHFWARKRGTYQVQAVFTPAPNTSFKPSASPVKIIRVK